LMQVLLLFTQPYLVEELFQLANEPMADYFQYRRIPYCL
jgi:hypothetical protein